jgi:hypothetical protein
VQKRLALPHAQSHITAQPESDGMQTGIPLETFARALTGFSHEPFIERQDDGRSASNTSRSQRGRRGG